ncbi:outer membrane biogenesis protein BamB [Planctomycetes bacterium MalM25]|nr:outer membrane biogenesis protein BamB [Planctomycetes bacterium MalM25]
MNAAEPVIEAMTTTFKPLRIWPAILLLAGMALARVTPMLVEDMPFAVVMFVAMGPLALGLLVQLWWLIASRASWRERLVGFFGVVVAAAVAIGLSHKSMLVPGSMLVTIPLGAAGFGLGAALCGRWLSFDRTWVALLLAVAGFGFGAMIRSEGVWGDMLVDWSWRWDATAEEVRLAKLAEQPTAVADEASRNDAQLDAWLASPEWPQFRGPRGDGAQNGPGVDTGAIGDSLEPLWKRPVGLGWSSFSVAGGLLFTQEQRGPMEAVVCYDAETGAELWKHEVESFFEDSIGGHGPRATPTLAGGALYALGASGHLMRLDPKTGDEVWAVDLREVAKRKPPEWGFSASPLVYESKVIVHAGGADVLGTLAFDTENGELAWSAPAGDHAYSSAQLGMIVGEEVVMILTNRGADLLSPTTGDVRLAYDWTHQGYRALQPRLVGDALLMPTGLGTGTRLVRLQPDEPGFAAEEAWTSLRLKSDYNDLVIHNGHAYGFDNAIFTCLDLENGERAWRRGGRYGKGQVLLLTDEDQLLVLGEDGEVILLEADPKQLIELARFQALEGRTWNHPVLVGDRLYVRNAQEAACYRLPMKPARGVASN